MSDELPRRAALSAALAAFLGTRLGHAFGDAGAFHPRVLSAGGPRSLGVRESGLGRWSWELVRRTSAPARLIATEVAADRPALYAEPFVVWAGEGDIGALTHPELRGIERFLRLGGVMVVDDARPESGAFSRSVRREIQRALPELPPVKLDPNHVIYRTYYILDRPVGRVLGPPQLDAIVRGKLAQVIFMSHDLLGALARSGEGWAFDVEPGGAEQREYAIRLAVNIAMYVLCSDYKDDSVHAPWLMRRRARFKQ